MVAARLVSMILLVCAPLLYGQRLLSMILLVCSLPYYMDKFLLVLYYIREVRFSSGGFIAWGCKSVSDSKLWTPISIEDIVLNAN